METNQTIRTDAKSLAAYKNACRLIPGGVGSPLHGAPKPGEAPIFIARGQGAVLTDLDGNEYIDYTCSRGSLILGHSDERVVVAIDKAASKGSSFGAPTESEVKLAELIVGRLESVDLVRLTESATEATAYAIRLARGFTNRDRIVRFQGCRHGLVDSLLGGTMHGADAETVLRASGVPAGVTADTLVLPYNDLGEIEKLLTDQGASIAAVLVEPLATGMGLIPPIDGYLTTLRELCDTHGSLLIFDETVTGFRVGPGGAAAYYGADPDLTILGSIIGGGLPLGALGGRREIMNHTPPMEERSSESDTVNVSPLAIAAGVASLQATAEEGFYSDLDQKAARLDEGLRAAAAATGVRTYHTRVGSVLGMYFTNKIVMDRASTQASAVDRFDDHRNAMLDRGVFLAPSWCECLFVSGAHAEQQIDKTIEAAHESLRLVAGNTG